MINNITYMLRNISAAVNICFKIMLMVNAQYAIECHLLAELGVIKWIYPTSISLEKASAYSVETPSKVNNELPFFIAYLYSNVLSLRNVVQKVSGLQISFRRSAKVGVTSKL